MKRTVFYIAENLEQNAQMLLLRRTTKDFRGKRMTKICGATSPINMRGAYAFVYFDSKFASVAKDFEKAGAKIVFAEMVKRKKKTAQASVQVSAQASEQVDVQKEETPVAENPIEATIEDSVEAPVEKVVVKKVAVKKTATKKTAKKKA